MIQCFYLLMGDPSKGGGSLQLVMMGAIILVFWLVYDPSTG